MADSQPYITVCSVCSVEFPAQCGAGYDIGTAGIAQTCPNGHEDNLYLKHESAMQVAQRIKVWWVDYSWWKPRKPVSENELIEAIGFGSLGEFEGMSAETRKQRESYLAQYRSLFHQAMTALAESGDYIQVDGDGELLSSDSRWFGQKEHWGRLFQAKTAEWSANIEAGEELQKVSRLIDSARKLSEQIGIRLDVADDLHSGRLGKRSNIKVFERQKEREAHEGVASLKRMLKKFGQNKKTRNTRADQHADQSKPDKRTPREVIVERGNRLRAETGFGPTNDSAELGVIFLTGTSMDVLQSGGVIVHPQSMDLNEAGLGFAFTCFMAAPVLAALGDQEFDENPNRFLVLVATSVFQFFDEDSQISIFKMGLNIFQKAVSSGADSDAFKEFTDQIDKLVMGYALTNDRNLVSALDNRYQAFRKLINK